MTDTRLKGCSVVVLVASVVVVVFILFLNGMYFHSSWSVCASRFPRGCPQFRPFFSLTTGYRINYTSKLFI